MKFVMNMWICRGKTHKQRHIPSHNTIRDTEAKTEMYTRFIHYTKLLTL